MIVRLASHSGMTRLVVGQFETCVPMQPRSLYVILAEPLTFAISGQLPARLGFSFRVSGPAQGRRIEFRQPTLGLSKPGRDPKEFGERPRH